MRIEFGYVKLICGVRPSPCLDAIECNGLAPSQSPGERARRRIDYIAGGIAGHYVTRSLHPVSLIFGAFSTVG